MTWKQSVRSLVFLLTVACLCGLAWRTEVEWHGWEGLLWTRYFHWAVPAGVLAFIAWAALAGEVRPNRRLPLALALVSVAAPLAGWTEEILRQRFATGPMMFLPFATGGAEAVAAALQRAEWWSMAPVAPAVVALIAGLFGVKRLAPRFLLSAALWYCAWPISIALLDWTNGRGSPDAIHAVKTGYLVPFLVVALGLLFVPVPSTANGRR